MSRHLRPSKLPAPKVSASAQSAPAQTYTLTSLSTLHHTAVRLCRIPKSKCTSTRQTTRSPSSLTHRPSTPTLESRCPTNQNTSPRKGTCTHVIRDEAGSHTRIPNSCLSKRGSPPIPIPTLVNAHASILRGHSHCRYLFVECWMSSCWYW